MESPRISCYRLSIMMNRREFTLGLAGIVSAPALALRAQTRMQVNLERLMGHLQALARIGAGPQGGISRVAFSDADRQGREYVLGLMRAAQLESGIDVAGNLVGRRSGRRPDLRPIAMGSHIDTVPEGGRYDGALGSLSAIEVAQVLAEQGIATHHPLEVLIFQDEEGGQFGSRSLIGDVKAQELDAPTASGKSVREGIRFIGGNPDRLGSARRSPGSLAGYLELHIEQGGVLDAEKIQVGVVEGIVGIYRWDVQIDGFANHAGTTPMDRRQDALLSAAGLIEAVHAVVTGQPGRQVGTVGKIQALPGAPNVIPGRVSLTVELRDLDAEKVRSLHSRIVEEAARIEKATGTRIAFRQSYANDPTLTDPRVRRLVEETARELGMTARLMPSGAGHDAQAMAALGPMGMIFVPSVGGISHSPKEFSRPEAVGDGANLLLHSALKLDQAD